MSFSVRGGILQNTVKIGALYNHMTTRIQGAMAQVAKQGLEYMRNDADLPIDEGDLQASTASGSNQSAVWFRYAVMPKGDGRPYGPAQNYGWHQHGGGFHEGHFFAQKTEIMASNLLKVLIALAWSDAKGIGGGMYSDFSDALGDANAVINFANPGDPNNPDIPTAADFNNP